MNASIRLLISIIAAGCFAGVAFAQDLPVLDAPAAVENRAQAGPQIIHITGNPAYLPDGKQNVDRDLSALHSLQKTGVVDTVGTVKDFSVRTDILVTGSTEWETLSFTLRGTSDAANVWVATELTDDFSNANLEDLERYILHETPDGSFSPDRGIIENDNEVFGLPGEDPDGDGRVDILLHDIEEGEGKGCCVLGYVTRSDVNLGNTLFVDLPNGMQVGGVIGIAGTIAHEYQHLIHYAYMSGGNDELTFVNEGMSEWAEVINGFFQRAITYLSNTSEHGTQLFTFRSGQSTSIVDRDYQRAGLFTTYIADRIGREETGRIVRVQCPSGADFCPKGQYLVGETGYAVVFGDNGLSVEEVVADFHAANLLNDRSLGDQFGYSLSQRQSLGTIPTEAVDGLVDTSPSLRTVNVPSGAVQYLSWTNVSDLQLRIADGAGADTNNRSRAALRLYTEAAGGSKAVVDLDPATQAYSLDGKYDEVTLIVAHIQPSNPQFSKPPLLLEVTGEWAGGGDYATESVVYDDGQMAYNVILTDGFQQASRFVLPQNARLSSVSVAPVYKNDFNDPETGEPFLPDGLPRDFNLHVWADDGTGLPGDEIYVRLMEENPYSSHFSGGSYSFSTISLPDTSVLADLPDTIYIGLSNAGTDENVLFLTTSDYEGDEDRSFLKLSSGWTPFSDVQTSEGEHVLIGKVLPIRATFLIPTDAEGPQELPSAVALAQNYPNPFNPTTSIRYSLPHAMHVRLSVYNMLGQRVATLVDGLTPGGEHVARFEAVGLASGVYVYALETEARTLTRRLVLTK